MTGASQTLPITMIFLESVPHGVVTDKAITLFPDTKSIVDVTWPLLNEKFVMELPLTDKFTWFAELTFAVIAWMVNEPTSKIRFPPAGLRIDTVGAKHGE